MKLESVNNLTVRYGCLKAIIILVSRLDYYVRFEIVKIALYIAMKRECDKFGTKLIVLYFKNSKLLGYWLDQFLTLYVATIISHLAALVRVGVLVN